MGYHGKGSKSKRNAGFKKQNCPWNKGLTFQTSSETDNKITRKPIKRLTHQEFDRTFKLCDHGEFRPAAEALLSTSVQHPSCLLRPKEVEKSEVQKVLEDKKDQEQVSGYSEVHLPTVVDVVQDCVIEHINTSPRCKGRLSIPAALVTKWGLCAIIQLKCNTCGYVSTKCKLYREVPRSGPGRRCAEPNRALAVGMLSTSLGMAGSQRLFSAIGNTLPATSSMQRHLNTVGDTIKDLNETDMARQRTRLKDTLENGGYPRDTPIPAELDRQYNNNLRSGRRHTPQAPATQSRDVLAENLTVDKKIIMYNQENKLCKPGELARAKGLDVQCPGHQGCTATLPESANIGDEKLGGRKLARSLTRGNDQLAVGVLVTDADGRGAEGFGAEMKEAKNVSTEHCLDTIHLNRAVARGISNASIQIKLATSTPCNYWQRQKAKHRLADSMAWRAEHEVRAAHLKYKNNHNAIESAIEKVIPSIITCYQGNHLLCIKQSLVCNGQHVMYKYVPKYAQGAYRFTKKEEKILNTVLLKRMGKVALHRTRLGLTTQKVEAMNHAFSTTYPKHSMTCYRNGANRDHSAIHMVNNPVGDSILLKARACGVPISPNSPCLRTLHQMNRRQMYHRLRSRSKFIRSRKVQLCMRRYHLYDMTRNESFYSKDQLIPK